MIYNLEYLSEDDVIEVKSAIKKLKDHDKIDLILEIILSKEKLKKLKKSKKKKVNSSSTITRQEMPEAVKFCTGDHCQISWQ